MDEVILFCCVFVNVMKSLEDDINVMKKLCDLF